METLYDEISQLIAALESAGTSTESKGELVVSGERVVLDEHDVEGGGSILHPSGTFRLCWEEAHDLSAQGHTLYLPQI